MNEIKKILICLIALILCGCLFELTETDVRKLEDATKGRWIKCPICNSNFARGEYFTNHKITHKEPK